ncbi:MAG TPA: Rrf2 family transcriptional regulator [Acidimicrobiales bacterium]|nr:Rrf2 family transcriptional regulator [Acidimicrobiales bacterium]
MRVTAKVDYAVRAMVELAAAAPAAVKGDELAGRQGIPFKFLENILAELRRAGLVQSQRGAEGGYWLRGAAGEISVADIIRAVEGPLADVRRTPPEDLDYPGAAEALQRVWLATRASLRRVLEVVTVADVVAGRLPAAVEDLLDAPGAWSRRDLRPPVGEAR